MQQEGNPYIQVVKLNKNNLFFWCHLIFLNFEKPIIFSHFDRCDILQCFLETLRSASAKLQVLQEEVFQFRGMIQVGKK